MSVDLLDPKMHPDNAPDHPVSPPASLLTADDLRRWLGYHRDGDVTRFLEKHRIPYWGGYGHRPVTTLGAIEDRLIGRKPEPEIIRF